MVARVGRINGDQVQIAQVRAPLLPHLSCRFGLGQNRVGEAIGDPVLVDRNQRHGARRAGVAQTLRDPRARQAQARRGGLLGLDKFAVAGALRIGGGHQPFHVGALVDGQNAPALGPGAIDAQNRARPALQNPDRMRQIPVLTGRRQFGQHPVALAQRGLPGALDHLDAGRGFTPLPTCGFRQNVAFGIWPRDAQNRHRRQIRAAVSAPLAPCIAAFGLHLAQQTLEVYLLGATANAESAADVAQRGGVGLLGQPGGQF